jgi:hypothetical protein
MFYENQLTLGGELTARLLPEIKTAPLDWRLRNTLRRSFILGWAAAKAAKIFSWLTGVPTITSELRARVISPDGEIVDHGVLSYRSVTDAGVAFLVDDWDNDATDITLMHFHASGTGAVAENVADTALGAESTTITDRVAGTESQPAANQLRTVATQAYTGSGAITEHGILSVITEGAGVLWDRSVFSVINVVNGNSIEWTYTCTINSGG